MPAKWLQTQLFMQSRSVLRFFFFCQEDAGKCGEKSISFLSGGLALPVGSFTVVRRNKWLRAFGMYCTSRSPWWSAAIPNTIDLATAELGFYNDGTHQ
jgi:hypothetical protein